MALSRKETQQKRALFPILTNNFILLCTFELFFGKMKLIRLMKGSFPMTYKSLIIKKGNPLVSGVVKDDVGYNFAFCAQAENVSLLLYKKGEEEPAYDILLNDDYRVGNVFSVSLSGIDFNGYEYVYRVGEKLVTDPYTRYITNGAEFAQTDSDVVLRSGIVRADYDWEDDKKPDTDFDDLVMYKLHTRGFTKHPSSKVKHKGTFAGVAEKLPYIKELGANCIVLMPPYEFYEYSRNKDIGAFVNRDTKKLNYWGYTNGLYFAPKFAYSCGRKGDDYTVEFKDLVKACHKEGIEVVIELYFDYEENPALILDCIRNWVLEYHIDGVNLCCLTPYEHIFEKDPLLSRTKLLYNYWKDSWEHKEGCKHLANMNDGFMNASRRFLKGDEDTVRNFLTFAKANPENAANINYLANHNSFTLCDMTSFDRKHNEVNGENNRDGADYNYSWNCGVEGASKKKKVVSLRLSQVKNALLMLFLSQGTPLVMAGDEFLNSQSGNNNPYCHDNEITWLNWRKAQSHSEITEFVKKLITFRKNHKILHMKDELKGMDYMSYGFPDVSYHSENAWYAHMENYNRHIGVLYCGRYCDEDELIYVAYNMHWENHELALPKLSKESEWKIVVSTGEGGARLNGKKNVALTPRSIAVLTTKL